jgi:deoxyribonuclease-4
VFASGYDIRDEKSYFNTFNEFDKIIGVNKIKVFHMNDSKGELGSRVDRHYHIGDGRIGEDGFRLIMNDHRFLNIPKIIETPKEDIQTDIKNIKKLLSLVQPYTKN